MPFPDWMTQYEMCFPIASEHFGPARLKITPTGYEKDTNGTLAESHRNQIYGLYVTTQFEDDGREFRYSISDFVPPEMFQELQGVIAEPDEAKSIAQLYCDDGYLDIDFQRVTNGDLQIYCKSPSPGWHVPRLRVRLECTVRAESLSEPRRQIGELVGLIKKIDSGSAET